MAANSLAQAQAQLAQANAALVNARKNLCLYNGYSAKRRCRRLYPKPRRLAGLALIGTALTTISDNSRVYAYFSMNEKEMLSLTDGGKYSPTAVSVDAGVSLAPADGRSSFGRQVRYRAGAADGLWQACCAYV